ncbi:MAG TPA: TPM domain-containing protein [Chitinophagaceae bacterium]|nr:TPM domain-containing protein [Chitinophagaceae bacterium]
MIRRFNPFRRKAKSFFTEGENHSIVKAIRHAEQQTSGEVRVFVESRCSWVDAIDRATEVFHSLKMENTGQRNAVLIYVAIKDRQLAVFGDEGIHQKVGNEYWNKVVGEMLSSFNVNNYAVGISNCVIQIGEALKTHFPYNRKTDKNELPDTIVFGR